MGEVVKLPRHARASSTATNENSRGSAGGFPSRSKASTKTKYWSAGIRRRSLQFETADGKTPANEAAADVPPTASMISSTDLSIPNNYSRSVNLSSLHETAVEKPCETATIHVMGIDHRAVKKRVRELPGLLELDAAEICRRIKVKHNRWSQYGSANSARHITLDVALQLKKVFGISLDWLYDGDVASMVGHPIHKKLAQAA